MNTGPESEVLVIADKLIKKCVNLVKSKKRYRNSKHWQFKFSL